MLWVIIALLKNHALPINFIFSDLESFSIVLCQLNIIMWCANLIRLSIKHQDQQLSLFIKFYFDIFAAL